ncbi:hypothetical protein HOLleu_44671 [Holothuria leucospilota]|uniref:Uncharacterized protein n=1 Tax=Holothuria leucospilota TaxID=206669 RepID=A0A9Q1BAA9_HOLLE|nr:hypothetical protein HOLleu_44671 [Holothuria leucospilota]
MLSCLLHLSTWQGITTPLGVLVEIKPVSGQYLKIYDMMCANICFSFRETWQDAQKPVLGSILIM